MKKTYIIPATLCITIHTESFIADSLHSMNNNGGTVTTSETELPSGIVSDTRRSSIWGDDEE